MSRSAAVGSGESAYRIERMQADHLRSEMRCALLERLEQHLLANGSDESTRLTASALVDHFDRTDHREAEERYLFPAMLRTATRRRKPRMAELVRSLATEHRELDAAWRALRLELLEVQRGTRDRLDGALVARFGNLALTHMSRESSELYSRALEIAGKLPAARSPEEAPDAVSA